MKYCLLLFAFAISSSFLNACGGGITGGGSQLTATHFLVTTNPTTITGTAFSFTVTALDASNNMVTTYSGTVHFTSSDSQAMLPANSTLTNGTGTFPVTLKTLGSQTITATDTITGSITGTSNSIKVRGTYFSVTTPPSATPGTAFNFTVTALDASNNTLTTYSGTVHFTSTDAQAVLPANSTLTNGTGTFSATLNKAGIESITATDTMTGSITGTSNSINVTSFSVLTITSGPPPNGTATMAYGSGIKNKCNWSPYRGWHLVCFPCLPGVVTCSTSLPGCQQAMGPSPCYKNFPGFVFTASGGTPHYSWSWSAAAGSSLPMGLSLDQQYGILSGTPSTSGTYHVTVTVTDSASPQARASANYAITINIPSAPVISSMPAPAIGTLNAPYVGFTFKATLGLPPLIWRETGALPPGMNITSDGVLSGTPTTAASFTITVTAQDSAGQNSTPQEFTLQVLTQGFLRTGSLGTARVDHTATLLSSGKVLVAGGASDTADLATAELFDPTAGSFSPTGSMETTRVSHTATLLSDGKVLITGGYGGGATAEIFDSISGTFAPTGSMETARYWHTATLLNGGSVLVTGGIDANGVPVATAEIFDPTSEAFTPAGSMETTRFMHTATLLNSGKVLVTGGGNNTAELFDPTNGSFLPTGSMETSRTSHTATLLNSGKVLVTGGGNDTTELFDPTNGSFLPTGSMENSRYLHTATLLSDGNVLVAGGLVNVSTPLSAAELFHPTSGTFTTTADMTTTRFSHTATLLRNSQVLVTGGQDGGGDRGSILATAELYHK